MAEAISIVRCTWPSSEASRRTAREHASAPDYRPHDRRSAPKTRPRNGILRDVRRRLEVFPDKIDGRAHCGRPVH